MNEITTVGLDLAKNVFYVHGVDARGKTVVKKKLVRAKVLEFFANLQPCLVGMDAGGGSNYWAREIKKLGHDTKVMAAQFVKPFNKSNKNDENDAEAISEAVTRPSMRFVPVKSVDQQDIQCVHRIRERLVTARSSLACEIRGLLGEYGIAIPQGIRELPKTIPATCLHLTLSPDNFFTCLGGRVHTCHYFKQSDLTGASPEQAGVSTQFALP